MANSIMGREREREREDMIPKKGEMKDGESSGGVPGDYGEEEMMMKWARIPLKTSKKRTKETELGFKKKEN